MNVEIQEIPDQHVAYIRKLGPYGPDTAGQAFMELGQWAGPRGYFGGEGKVLGVYWDNPEVTPPEKCRTDACLTVPEGTEADGGINMQTLTGGRCAICHFETVMTQVNALAQVSAHAHFKRPSLKYASPPPT